MLVRFDSSACGQMVMLADNVHDLFKIINKECTQRGVFMKEQLPDAIARLQGTVDEDKLETKLAKMSDDKEVHTRHETYPSATEGMSKNRISLVQRAKPFIHFLELTKNENGFILWETEKDF